MFWKKNKSENEIGPSVSKFVWRGYSMTDIGMVRSQNEDAVFLSTRFGEKEFVLAIVCDGMGGHAAGDVASAMCVTTICDFLEKKTPTVDMLKKAVLQANRAIFDFAKENTQHKGMGTTCSVLVAYQNQLHWAHVGDSHIYKLNSELELLTEDHTLEYQKQKDGLPLLPGDEHVLTMAMGTKPDVQPHCGTLNVEANNEQRFLLCTDGLYNLVSGQELLLLGMLKPASLSAQSLVALAKERGGTDNITVCILDYQQIKADDKQTISN